MRKKILYWSKTKRISSKCKIYL